MIDHNGFSKTYSLHIDVPVEAATFFLVVPIYMSESNTKDNYPRDHPINRDAQIIETVSFEVGMDKIRQHLKPFRATKRKRRVRRTKQHTPGQLQPTRRSSRIAHGTGSIDLLGSSISQIQQLPSLGNDEFEASTSSPDDDNTNGDGETEDALKEFYRVRYRFIMEIDDVVLSYQLLCPDGDVSEKGTVWLSYIYEPGTVIRDSGNEVED